MLNSFLQKFLPYSNSAADTSKVKAGMSAQ